MTMTIPHLAALLYEYWSLVPSHHSPDGQGGGEEQEEEEELEEEQEEEGGLGEGGIHHEINQFLWGLVRS